MTLERGILFGIGRPNVQYILRGCAGTCRRNCRVLDTGSRTWMLHDCPVPLCEKCLRHSRHVLYITRQSQHRHVLCVRVSQHDSITDGVGVLKSDKISLANHWLNQCRGGFAPQGGAAHPLRCVAPDAHCRPQSAFPMYNPPALLPLSTTDHNFLLLTG
jgi:hypothetical protein